MAVGSFEVIAGDYRIGGGHQLANEHIVIFPKTGWKWKKVAFAEIASVERISEESGRSMGGALGWGVAGALIAGPIGAVGAGLLGSKKDIVTFRCVLRDRTQFIGQMKAKPFAAFEAHFLLAPPAPPEEQAPIAEPNFRRRILEPAAPDESLDFSSTQPPPVVVHDQSPSPAAAGPFAVRPSFGKRRPIT